MRRKKTVDRKMAKRLRVSTYPGYNQIDQPTKHLETIENSMQIKVLLNRQHIQELGRASESKIILDLESYT